MKKLIYLLATSILAMGLMMGCSKKDDVTPEEKQKQEEEQSKNATLKITLYDKTTQTYLSGANTVLYNASDDAMVAVIVSNEKGIATFSNLDISKTYYFGFVYEGQEYEAEDEITVEKGENTINYTVETTILTITVKNSNGNAVSGATVRLYGNFSDYSNEKNIIGSSLYTDSKGQVTFYNLSSGSTYYFKVINDTQNNESSTYYKYCSNGSNTASTTIKEEIKRGTIVLENNATGSDGGEYKFVVTNTTTGYSIIKYVDSGYSLTLEDLPIGSYTIDAEQIDGYLFKPTKGSSSKVLQNGSYLTFSTSNMLILGI
ncbi:MAG: Ig-like domain-containing protein [Bacteroidales bacterium]|nr:Ig-like domain-containing protein [Bacteroidales bacterium]